MENSEEGKYQLNRRDRSSNHSDTLLQPNSSVESGGSTQISIFSSLHVVLCSCLSRRPFSLTNKLICMFSPFFALSLLTVMVPLTSPMFTNVNEKVSSTELNRPKYHAMPLKNWCNDPNGVMVYKGYYHLFYQYNPDSAIWGNMHWGHMVSEDLINWKHLPIALSPDQWYDKAGVFSGSATILDDGTPILLYTGVSSLLPILNQTQSIAFPVDSSDPLLIHWIKSPKNPLMNPPPQGRDPTTAWKVNETTYVMAIGSTLNGSEGGKDGAVYMFSFSKYEPTNMKYFGRMYKSKGTGILECPDVFQLKGRELYALKSSLIPPRRDFYILGTVDPISQIFTRSNNSEEMGSFDQILDSGIFYASKTFKDENHDRRILIGWVDETVPPNITLSWGWAGLQSLPRLVIPDNDNVHILTPPVSEVVKLRKRFDPQFHRVLNLFKGEVNKLFRPQCLVSRILVALPYHSLIVSNIYLNGFQAEFLVVFNVTVSVKRHDDSSYPTNAKINYDNSKIDNDLKHMIEGLADYSNTEFGLIIRHTRTLSEYITIGFKRQENNTNMNGNVNLGRWKFFVNQSAASDDFPSSKLNSEAPNVPFLPNFIRTQNGYNYYYFTMGVRMFIDHSVVEMFVQNGRPTITARIYSNVEDSSGVSAYMTRSDEVREFNIERLTANVEVWEMNSMN